MSTNTLTLLWSLPAFCCVVMSDLPSGFVGYEKLLFQNVTFGYNSISRPVRDASKQVEMSFGVSVNQIIDLDEKHQILSSYVWIYEKWTDENLKWFPADFNGMEKVMFPATHIWVPDIYIFNVAGSALDGFINVTGSYVVVHCNGLVQWSIPLLIKSACPVDATFFPYDKQTCDVYFGSWIYDISQIDINLDPVTPDLSQYVINNEFDLESVSLTKDMANSSCCPGDGVHPMVHLEIRLKRKTLYYDYIVIAPTINLCILTLATFLLPCECGWKIAIGLTVFLTLYVLQLLIAENVPDTNSTPLISVFLLLVMSLNCISLIMATIIMNIKKRSQIDPVPNVPPLLLNICENYLSKIACTKPFEWKKIATAIKETNDTIGQFVTNPADQNSNCEQQHQCVQLYEQHLRKSRNSVRSKYLNSRIPTAESSFLASTANDTFIREMSCKDRLLKKDSISPDKNSSNINQSFNTKDEDTDTVIEQKYETDLSDAQIDGSVQGGLPTYTQKRSSYKRAIRGGHYSHMTSVGRRRQFRSAALKRASVFSGLDMKYQWFFVADVIDATTFLVYIIVMFVGILTVLVIVPTFA